MQLGLARFTGEPGPSERSEFVLQIWGLGGARSLLFSLFKRSEGCVTIALDPVIDHKCDDDYR